MSTWLDLKNNSRLKNIYTLRAQIIRHTREWFWEQGFLETDTPLAVRYPGQEPYLSPVSLVLNDARNTSHNFYLQTSPEYSLKKLLAVGYEKIFQITKTFRNGEDLRGTHSPEFTMLEWYRAPGVYTDFMDDMENLFKHVAKNLNVEKISAGGGSALGGKYKDINIVDAWDRKSMKEIWKEFVDVNLDDYLTLEAMRQLSLTRGQRVVESDTYDDLFFKIFLNEIEPNLGLEKPIFVYDYPAQMCSLSRLTADPRYAERAECYIGGLEMCNGFGELTDPDIQKEQLERDRDLRHSQGKDTWSVDPDFIAALRSGIPSPTAGVALGVDRMVVLFTGAKDINEVIFNSQFDQLQIQ